MIGGRRCVDFDVVSVCARRRNRLAQAALAFLALLLSGTAGAAPHATTCGSVVVCSTVTVPLDRSGRVPGTVSLHVEVLRPDGPPRGTVFLLAGGPGQGSAHTFSLGTPLATVS